MKYPQLVSSTTPASLQDWLEGELESLGIDGVYTRYILSLLQEDYADLDPPECEHLFGKLEKSHYRQTGSYYNLGKEYPIPLSGKSKHHRWKNWEKEKLFRSEIYCNCMVLLDSEEKKKSVAVECLKSASEQKIGIEKLIDEVCAKLKKVKPSGDKKDVIKDDFGSKVLLSSPQEQAEKYYAAFPALNGKREPLTKLCQQQKSKKFTDSVWEKKKNYSQDGSDSSFCVSEYIINTASDEEFSSDCDSSFDRHSDISDKEYDRNMEEMQKTTEELSTETMKYTFKQQPSFIVPKLKMSLHQVPFSIKYLPFTPVNLIEKITVDKDASESQTSKFDSDTMQEITSDNIELNDTIISTECQNPVDDGKLTKQTNEKKNVFIEDNKDLEVVMSQSNNMRLPFNESFENEEYNYSKFAGKFNNQLASIWTPNIAEVVNKNFELSYPLVFEVSLKDKKSCFSFKFLEHSIKDIKSIWTVSPDDFKLLSAESTKLFPLTYFLSNNPVTLHSEIRNCIQTEDNSDYLQNGSNDIVIEGSETNEEEDDKSSIHSLSNPEKTENSNNEISTFSLWKDHLPVENYSEKNGIYSLWQTSSISILAVERKSKSDSYFDEKPFLNEEVSKNFTDICQYDRDSHWCSDDCIHAVFANETSLNKAKCTLTYHKGESLFVEVTPSSKLKSLTELEMSPFEENLINYDKLGPPSSESDDLLTSPKTHFQPIHQDSMDAENCEENVTIMPNLNDSPPVESEFKNIIIPKCIENLHEVLLSDNNCTQLEEYSSPVNKQNDHYGKQNICSISSFKNLPATNDGADEEKTYEEIVNLNNFSLSDIGEVWNTNNYKEKTENLEISNPFLLNCHEDVENAKFCSNNTNDKFSIFDNNDDNISSDNFLCSDTPCNIEKWKWSTENNDEYWNLHENAPVAWQSINELCDFVSLQNIKKLDTKNNLEALKKEIEEEEDELFRDITRMNDETCGSETESPETILSNYYGYENEYFMESRQWSEDVEFSDFPYTSYCAKQFNCWDSSVSEKFADQYDSSVGVNSSNSENGSVFPLIPANKVLYSSDLEDEWRRTSHAFGVSHSQRIKHKYKAVSQKKPCTFYLEGSCRRSDCKFSHDLGKITCRFWEEGSCFKGITCPFLHGYSSEGHFRHEECRHRKCNYTLDSEADFPSLSSSVPQDFEKEKLKEISTKSTRRKRRRVKIQHGVTVSSSWPQQRGNKH